jgi:excisionase family DNA binding protein
VTESADGEWLTVEQVAEHLGLAVSTVRSLVSSGDLAAHFVVPSPRPKLRRRVARIRPKDVDDFVARARVRPGDLAHLYPQQPSSSQS